jgi:ammonium transporter, Amt family
VDKINAGDTAWVLVSAALVMLMTPALGFFYGGLVRKKNVLSTIFYSFLILALISVQWVLYGYSLAFGPDHGGVIGGLDWIGLNGVGLEPNPDYAPTIPHQAYMLFQMFFAVITPALITGAFAERKRFKSFLIFSLLWATLVYDPIAHWVWSTGGWLHKMGALDFAGGTVVHISSGVSALVAALVLGKRLGLGKEPMEPHDATMTILGAALLWFGWFGFNAGSALSASSQAAMAFATTNTASASAALAWIFFDRMRGHKPSALGACVGAVVGLVAITPAAGYVGVGEAIFIGTVASVVSNLMVHWKNASKLDDTLEVFPCHGVGGMVGMLMTGIFAKDVGLMSGHATTFLVHCGALVFVAAFSFCGSWLLYRFTDFIIPMRVSEEQEEIGLDLSQHGEVMQGEMAAPAPRQVFARTA